MARRKDDAHVSSADDHVEAPADAEGRVIEGAGLGFGLPVPHTEALVAAEEVQRVPAALGGSGVAEGALFQNPDQGSTFIEDVFF